MEGAGICGSRQNKYVTIDCRISSSWPLHVTRRNYSSVVMLCLGPSAPLVGNPALTSDDPGPVVIADQSRQALDVPRVETISPNRCDWSLVRNGVKRGAGVLWTS